MLEDIVYKVLLWIGEENRVDFNRLDVSEKGFVLGVERVGGEDLGEKICKFEIRIDKRVFLL
ncbi:hypothetical protein [Staphylococcus hominis]|uniref:hypothetical protein n=1 Tax=Staphylococcus hominis TaxID=1290 RepID=UPI00119DAF91|nr:hypothetical protein [Staphylococcus hominis]